MALFYLENQQAERIDLQNDAKYCIATDVHGVGIEYESSYTKTGDHFVRDYREQKIGEITLDLNFFQPDVYDKQQAVSNFLLTAEELRLVYKPQTAADTEYKRNVDMTSFKKNGVKDGYLCYTLTLEATSPFYQESQTRFAIEEIPGEKRYKFQWDSYYNDYSDRSIEIAGGNHMDPAFDLEIYGYTHNPKIEVIDTGGNTVNELTFPVTVEEGERLYYSSRDENISVELIKADGSRQELFNSFSLETDIFFKIPKTGATIRFTSDTDVANTIILTAYIFYGVV